MTKLTKGRASQQQLFYQYALGLAEVDHLDSQKESIYGVLSNQVLSVSAKIASVAGAGGIFNDVNSCYLRSLMINSWP